MAVTITPIYAALITLLYLALTWHVISYRRANLISVGDKGDMNLLKRMRAQANCAEYAPLGLVLILMVELTGAPNIAVHLLGLALLGGRIAHAYGFASTPQKMMFRQIGMVLTLLMLVSASFGLLAHTLF